jgi:hypothetical protein
MTTVDQRTATVGPMTIVGIEGAGEGDDYRAGACNIGPSEVGRRRRAGLAGVTVGIGLAALLLAIDAPAWTRLAIALPLAGGLVSLEQARQRFCVGFAFAGLRNFGELGQEERVTDAAARAADRRAAIRLALPPALLGMAIALVFALLPL